MNRMNLKYYLNGYLIVELKGEYVERFLNMCRAHDIYLWNIRCSSDKYKYYCNMCCGDFKDILPLLRKTGTRVHVSKKRGVPFGIKKIKIKSVFWAGVIICLISLYSLSGYVWAVEFVGNYKITNDELMDFLKEESIHYGMKKACLDCEYEEKKLRARFEDIIWTSIYFEGTKLYIEIKENDKTISVDENEVVGYDIVASCSGIITSIITRNGVPKVKIGDQVEEGEILVEGNVPIFDEGKNTIGYHTYNADADIFIKTALNYQEDIDSIHQIIAYSGNKTNTYFVEIPGYFIETFSFGKYVMSEKITKKWQLKILDNIYLPVFYGNIIRQEYHIEYIEYTKEEMKNILFNNFNEFILCLQEKGVQILEKNVKISNNDNNMGLDAEIILIKPCGRKIMITNTLSEE